VSIFIKYAVCRVTFSSRTVRKFSYEISVPSSVQKIFSSAGKEGTHGIGDYSFVTVVNFAMPKKKPLGRPRRRWLDNIKMDLLEIGWGGVDWIGLAQDRDKWRALVNAVMNLRVP
jgi:hypothetical protein